MTSDLFKLILEDYRLICSVQNELRLIYVNRLAEGDLTISKELQDLESQVSNIVQSYTDLLVATKKSDDEEQDTIDIDPNKTFFNPKNLSEVD